MTKLDDSGVDRNVVELVFDLGESDIFFREASEITACRIELETIIPRSDGTVLEFLAVDGADPEEFSRFARAADGIQRTRLIDRWEDGGLFELVSNSRIATTIADQGALYSDVTATSGQGRLEVEVPPQLDASDVIDAFLSEYPEAELVARRATDRSTPVLSRNQFVAELLDDLTEKQVQALRVAHANGYFEWPRQSRAAEIADDLGITTPTFSQHLRSAECKVFDALFS